MGEFPGAADLSVRVCACACACVYTCVWSRLTANVFFLPKNNSCNCGFSFCCPAAYPESPPRHSRTSQPASHLQPRVLLSWECRQRVHGEALLRFLGPSSGPRPRGAGSGQRGARTALLARTLCSRPFRSSVLCTACVPWASACCSPACGFAPLASSLPPHPARSG